MYVLMIFVDFGSSEEYLDLGWFEINLSKQKRYVKLFFLWHDWFEIIKYSRICYKPQFSNLAKNGPLFLLKIQACHVPWSMYIGKNTSQDVLRKKVKHVITWIAPSGYFAK